MVSASKNTVEPPSSTSVIYIRTHRHKQSVIFTHCLKFLYHGNGTCSSQNFVDASTSVQVGSLTFTYPGSCSFDNMFRMISRITMACFVTLCDWFKLVTCACRRSRAFVLSSYWFTELPTFVISDWL